MLGPCPSPEANFLGDFEAVIRRKCSLKFLITWQKKIRVTWFNHIKLLIFDLFKKKSTNRAISYGLS
jgi:hypothetical protein